MMLPQQPTSTLFPYTTLFRSGSGHAREAPPRDPRLARRDRAARDRKSTRLNSSHVAISYAVFCLIKKYADVTQIAHQFALLGFREVWRDQVGERDGI